MTPATPTKLSVQSELDRKVGDSVERYVEALEAGNMSSRDCRSRLKGLWDASAGLLSPDVLDLLSAAIQYAQTK